MKIFYITAVFLIAALHMYAQEERNQKQDWVIEVHLKNGSKLNGVAQSGIFVEHRVAGQYKVLRNQNKKVMNDLAKNKERRFKSSRGNIGIRLWYVRNSNGNIFIPFRNVNKIVVIKKGYDKSKIRQKRRELLNDYKDQRKEREEARQKRQQKKQQEEREQAAKDRLTQKEKELKKAKLTKEEKKLLEDFPPGAEWNQAERNKLHKQINRARNNKTFNNGTIQKNRFGGVNKQERTFYKSYDAWTVAVEKKKKLDVAEAKAKAEAAKAEAAKTEAEKANGKVEAKEEKSEIIETDKSNIGRAIPQESKERKMSDREIMNLLSRGKNKEKKLLAIKNAIRVEKAIPYLIVIADDSNEDLDLRLEAVLSLGKIFKNEQEIISIFKRKIDSGRKSMRLAALDAMLLTEEDLSALEFVIRIATADLVEEVRYKAILVIKKQFFTSENAEKAVTLRLKDSNLDVQVAALSTLISMMQEKGATASEIKKLDRHDRIFEQGQKSEKEEVRNLVSKYFPMIK